MTETAEVIHLEKSRSRIYTYAEHYARIMQEGGWLPAGQYLASYVPAQLRDQVKKEADLILKAS